MTLPLLYSFRRCPYAMRARMALAAAGIAYETVEVALRDKPPALLAISAKGTVPVLHLPTGEVIDQSLGIMRWALAQHDPEGWMLAEDAGTLQHWIALCDERFKPLLDRYKYANRHPELSQEAHRANALQAFILPLENALQVKRDAPSQASLADVAMFPFVRQFAGVDPSWFNAAPLPALQAWLRAWLSSALFASAMQR